MSARIKVELRRPGSDEGEFVSVRTERCPGLRERDGTRPRESGGLLTVRPEGNKEIMAPRCVCSRMEGGGGCGGLGRNGAN